MSDAHIIIAGQSNALGFLNTGPAPYTPTAQVQIWTDTNGDGVGDAFNYMRPGVNTGTAANPTDWGPEVQEANDWLKVHAGDGSYLWIVKDGETVHGSTGLAHDATQLDWSPASTGEMYATTVAAARNALAYLHGGPYSFDHYDVFDFMQGETDATDPTKAAAYETNLTGFVAAVRRDLPVQDFVLGRIGDGVGAPADNLAVRVAQWDVDQADAHVGSFKTIGFERQSDNLHYDAVGQVALGHGFFDAWAAL